MSAPTMTIFTPTYNRAHTLARLFSTLLEQSVQDFEWLVVDDGSTDDTKALVQELSDISSFAVRYYHQENAGKHVAANRAAREADGEVLWTVDSDDWLLPDSVERMLNHWAAVVDDPGFAAVTGQCVSPDGRILGARFPSDVLDSNSLELRYRHRVTGDKAGFTRTSILREYPFPEGEHDFVPEGIVWNAIAANYATRYVNEAVLVKEYQADGLTRGGTSVGPRGMAMYHQTLLTTALPYLVRSPKDMLASAVHYVRFSLQSGRTPRQTLAALPSWQARALALVAFPLGVFLARR